MAGIQGTGKTLTATVFPQPVGLAASWDRGLAQEVGRDTAREVRALHDAHPLISLNVWAPVVNLLRDPRWGRNEEGYPRTRCSPRGWPPRSAGACPARMRMATC